LLAIKQALGVETLVTSLIEYTSGWRQTPNKAALNCVYLRWKPLLTIGIVHLFEPQYNVIFMEVFEFPL
jgi:hypothetical protein